MITGWFRRLRRAGLGIALASVAAVPALARPPVLPITSDVVGNTGTMTTRYEDTFADIGTANSVGYLALVHANPAVDPWLPGKGTQITLPTEYVLPPGPRKGIVINLAEYRLYYYRPNNQVQIYPIGVGTDSNPSPVASTEIKARINSPTWYPPKSVRAEHASEGDYLPAVVPPGPDNPLGPYALQLGVDGYFIHGTNKQFGIGTRVSHGCIRMYNSDITALFKEVAPGTPVRMVNEPIKLGMRWPRLYIEVHRADEAAPSEQTIAQQEARVEQRLQSWTLQYPALKVDRTALQEALQKASGLPTAIAEYRPDNLMARGDSQCENHTMLKRTEAASEGCQ